MIYGVFAIRDKKTCFMSPIVDMSDQSAIRNFSRAVNGEGNLMDFAPDDFDLYQIGTYDDQSGRLEPFETIQFIINGASLVGVRYEK